MATPATTSTSRETQTDGYFLRFKDGPMAHRGNASTLESTLIGAPAALGDTVLPREVFGWPLPDRLGILAHEGVLNVAFWDADDPAEAKLPAEITDSPNAIVYRKISESKLDHDDFSHVIRGALYEMETGE